MSKVIIAGQEHARTWSASGSQGVSLRQGIYPYERVEPWKSAALLLEGDDVVSTTKSLGYYPIRGNTKLQGNGETPHRLLPLSMVVDPWSMTTLNAWGHSSFGLVFHDRVGTFGSINRPWVLSIITDQLEWKGKEQELHRICDFLDDPLTRFKVRPVIEFVGGCANADIPLENILRDNAAAVRLIRNRMPPPWVVVNNITPIAPPEVFQAAQDAGADCIRLCNTIPHGHPLLPEDIKWAKRSPLMQRIGKPGAYSGPACAPIILDVLDSIRPLISVPIGVGNGFYTVELIAEAYRRGADFISLGMIKLYRPWRLQSLIEAANTLK